MLFSASKSSLEPRAGWLRSSRGCCGLDVLTHKKTRWVPAFPGPDPGCWVRPCLLPPPRCPGSRGSFSRRDAKPLGCKPKCGLAGCTKDRLLGGLAGQRLPLSPEHGHAERAALTLNTTYTRLFGLKYIPCLKRYSQKPVLALK